MIWARFLLLKALHKFTGFIWITCRMFLLLWLYGSCSTLLCWCLSNYFWLLSVYVCICWLLGTGVCDCCCMFQDLQAEVDAQQGRYDSLTSTGSQLVPTMAAPDAQNLQIQLGEMNRRWLSLMTKSMEIRFVIIIIIIIIIVLKGAIRDLLQSPHSASNCLQHVHSSGPSTIVCKSCATHQALITCNMSFYVPCGTKGQLSF